METQFKVQDSVQLLNGHTPTMTISEIYADSLSAKCFWYDTKTKKMNSEILPLNILKPTPERGPIDIEAIKRISGYR